jgi:hypothetical protein
MNRPALGLIVVGMLIFCLGAVLSGLDGGPPKAGPAQTQQCQDKLRAQGADAGLIGQCGQAAFAAEQTATDAQSAAKAISAANNHEVGASLLSKLLCGLGLALAIGGLVILRRQRDAARRPG